MNCQHTHLKVECVHSKIQTLRYPEPTAIKQFYNKVKRRLKFT